MIEVKETSCTGLNRRKRRCGGVWSPNGRYIYMNRPGSLAVAGGTQDRQRHWGWEELWSRKATTESRSTAAEVEEEKRDLVGCG